MRNAALPLVFFGTSGFTRSFESWFFTRPTPSRRRRLTAGIQAFLPSWGASVHKIGLGTRHGPGLFQLRLRVEESPAMTLSTFFTVETDRRHGDEIILLSGSLATHPVRARHHAPGVGEARRLLRDVRSAQATGAIERRLLLDGAYAMERQSPDTTSPPQAHVIRRSPTLIDASQLWSVVNDEALLEGPQAVRELYWFKARYDVASTLLMMRQRSGLTQHRLATAAGIPPDRISDIENGTGNPTLHTLVTLSKALGAEVTISGRGEHVEAPPGAV